MSLRAVTHVNHLAQQEREKAKMTRDTYGPTSETPLAQYDPATHCWKMYAATSLWGSTECLQTLPRSGMTQNGALFPRPALVPLIDATALFVWPTPTTQEVEHPLAELTATGRRKSKNGNTHSLNLADSVRLWPTPTVDDSKNVTRKSGGFQSLTRTVQGESVTNGKLNPTWVEWLMGFPLGWTDLEA